MPTDKFSILIVEDNRAMAQVLRFNFERSGFEASLAFDGLDAIRQLNERQFDLVITDLQMPGVDGAGVCHHIRNELMLPDLPILLCSAKGLEVNAKTLMTDYGVRHVFSKPFSPQTIIAFVDLLMTAETATQNCIAV